MIIVKKSPVLIKYSTRIPTGEEANWYKNPDLSALVNWASPVSLGAPLENLNAGNNVIKITDTAFAKIVKDMFIRIDGDFAGHVAVKRNIIVKEIALSQPFAQGYDDTVSIEGVFNTFTEPLKYWDTSKSQIVALDTSGKSGADITEAAVLNVIEENREASSKLTETEGRKYKFLKMLKRLERLMQPGEAYNNITDVEAQDFIMGIIQNQYDRAWVTALKKSPLTTFIDDYDATNVKFDQVLQDILIGIIDSA